MESRVLTRLTAALFFILCFSCNSQPSGDSSPFAPEEGTYTGGTLNVSASMTYSYNPIMGFGTQPTTSITPGINLLGDLQISTAGANQGTYAFTKMNDWTGEWTYNPDSDELSFTGPLNDALRSYHAGKGAYTMQFLIKSKPADKDGIVYYFSKKASKEFPKQQKPNGAITGTITIKPDLKSIAFLNLGSGALETSFNGAMAATNASHYTLALSFTDSPHYKQIAIVDPTGKATIYTPSTIQGYGWAFSDYEIGVLNNDQTKMALLGKVPDRIEPEFQYIPGKYAVGVFTVSGNQLGLFPVEYNKLVKPAFLADGRLVYCPENGGIAITNADFTASQTIYSNPLNAFAVSPDGQTIAFSEGIDFYTMNMDGSGKKKIICNGGPLQVNKAENVIDMGWSPDGKYLAFTFNDVGGYSIVVAPLDGGSYRFVKDADGEILKQSGQLMSWH